MSRGRESGMPEERGGLNVPGMILLGILGAGAGAALAFGARRLGVS